MDLPATAAFCPFKSFSGDSLLVRFRPGRPYRFPASKARLLSSNDYKL